jgi:hypothetical protein
VSAAVAIGVTIWLLTIAGLAKPGTDRANARLDAVRTGLAAGAGAGAAVGVMLAFRRQHHQEIATVLTDLDATERRITELYTKAVEQLGSEKAPVRLGGLYALERLAQDNPAHRQTIVNVICAYLRMPFSPAAPASGPMLGNTEDIRESARSAEMLAGVTADDTWQQEKQVRLTAQRILGEHLSNDQTKIQPSADPPGPRFWPGIRLDLTGATLIDFGLRNGIVTGASFDAATFTGRAWFAGAAFTGNARFDGAAFTEDARFDGATFTGDVDFDKAAFAGDARFDGAAFDGVATFNDATFGGRAELGGTIFAGGTEFNRATFTGDAIFRRATFSSDAAFGQTTFSGGVVMEGAAFNGHAGFQQATFTGDAWLAGVAFDGVAVFDDATFGGRAEFRDATFTGGDAMFARATFTGGDAMFIGATFTPRAFFSSTAFNHAAFFNRATFTSSAIFDHATFSGNAVFADATFSERAYFGTATFGGTANFQGANFIRGEDRVAFERSLVLSPDAQHTWPTGWSIGPVGSGEQTVIRTNTNGHS